MPRHGENIRKRSDGRWEGRYIESYSVNGKAYYRSVYGKTYTEAKEKLKEFKNIEAQKITKKISVEELCREWLSFKKESVKPSTFVKYTNTIEKHIIPHFRQYKAIFLTNPLVGEFISGIKDLSEKSIHDILTLFFQIIKYGQAHNYVGSFDFSSVTYPKVPSKELPVLKNSEFTKLVNYIRLIFEIRKIGVLLSLFMGIRLGELCALQWRDVNFAEETISISKTMQRLKVMDSQSTAKTRIVIDAPKSQNSMREIPIPSFLLELLKEHKTSDEAYILTGTGSFIEPRVYQDMFKRYLKEAGLQDINFHALRHTFATRAVEQEFDIKSLSEILGHSSVKFTLERYVHPSDAYKKQNLEKLAVFY